LHAATFMTGTGPERAALAGEMVRRWTDFARCGSPNSPGSPAWPPYDLTARPTMIFDRLSHIAPDPGRHDRTALVQAGLAEQAIGND
jgi:para-nitrobenzyl esterase